MKQFDPDVNIRPKEDSARHYSVPDDYFSSFTDKLMAQIPAVEAESDEMVHSVALWHKLRPLLYLAASFLLMIGMFKAFSLFGESGDTGKATSTSAGLVALDHGDARWSEDTDYRDFLHDNCAETVSDEWVLTDFSE
ncbi:hypothetical protein HR17_02095 [Porphyromonas gulae]|uniref:Uncharacterized protein n=1 Tax=Porphyromonas gulae TaxID=111105 RepID=A0A0A2GPT8_9PORP|nr:hypothetical protein [Porphyromonas gulae]KGN68898.1 hypothetical protein HR09_06720 [Porphyromonas gulae]KGN75398.1 hypothetical protein HQ40_06390 [Porphyromonas gulae]KGN76452.1 hypothetical protein HR17_02095 [Porphyromonas gulae]KGN79027.1 hypothetical protein HR13_07530 [Porphyromonas gulae]KGN84128.1 hypothetical protein HR08_09520 [Porphyromonas gulae]